MPDEDRPWWTELSTPALLRHARGSYGDAIRAALEIAGCDDVPRNGAFVIGSLDRTGDRTVTAQSDAVRWLGVSKQAASQLIDTLVLRGYLERQPDGDDRRRMSVRLTDRGVAAAEAIRGAVTSVDAELGARITAAQLDGLRTGLAALAEIRLTDR